MKTGFPSNNMPLVIGIAAAVLASILLSLVDALPGPSVQDIAVRKKREAMSLRAGFTLIYSWGWGLAGMLLVYALLTGLRSFRDL